MADAAKLSVRELSLWYGHKQALDRVSFDLSSGECLAFIGPSGCGKSTMLKCLNRMHEGQRDVHIDGEIRLDGRSIYDASVDSPTLRRRFGWVAQKPNPFAWSIHENVAYPSRLHAIVDDDALEGWVETCLRRADLWDEVKDRLHAPAFDLSGGQQQRLCIARALSTRPDVMLMDEPCGSIDPSSTAHIEALIAELRETSAVVIITHNMEQARRVADRVAYFHLGRLLEIAPTEALFTAPRHAETRGFIAGRFG
ncbi:MAG: phosphate ABC transporter ATP-binding protein [Pseudomonadota bacterium]